MPSSHLCLLVAATSAFHLSRTSAARCNVNSMRVVRSLLLPLLAIACSQSETPDQRSAAPAAGPADDVRSEFLALAGSDSWAKWPDGVQEDPLDDGQPCYRVTDEARQEAVQLLSSEESVALDGPQAGRLTGGRAAAREGTLYLLRGFSTTNSAARVKVTEDVVTVHSDALGGLFNLRRHPCVAALGKRPSKVYTMAAYDF
jgi:hypothetical protein